MQSKPSSNETTYIWSQQGEVFLPTSTATNLKKIPPGIYEYRQSDRGWFLEKTAQKYAFSFKLYGVNNKILKRVNQAYDSLSENLGIMLNGLKGTGKTVTAQQIINWAIDKGLVVLNVQHPVPLATIMARVEQPLLVLFDEFEKTHKKDEDQQNLLSAIDGLSRSEHRRIFVFTTNEKNINGNLIDRPSRIRYIWNFAALDENIVNELIDDLLSPELKHLKPDINLYLNTREIVSIDVVKTVVKECNAFKESPNEFKSFMNMSEKEPSAFIVDRVDESGHSENVLKYFRPMNPNSTWFSNLFTEAGKSDFLNRYVKNSLYQDVTSYSTAIRVYGPTDVGDEWICSIRTSLKDSWLSTKLQDIIGISALWEDEKPINWQKPSWARKMESGQALTVEEDNEYSEWLDKATLYGGAPKKMRFKFRLDHTPIKYGTNSYNYDY